MTNEITFKRSSLAEETTYELHPYAYIHTAEGESVALNRLRENDRLTVYLLDGKIMELIQ